LRPGDHTGRSSSASGGIVHVLRFSLGTRFSTSTFACGRLRSE